MTLDFRYDQYDPEYFMFIGLPLVIGFIGNLVIYLFVFFSAKERKEDSDKPEYLKIFAIIGMISAFIPLFLPTGFYYVLLTEDERSLIVGYFILQGLVRNIPFFMANILLFMYSLSNRNKFGLYLLGAGILGLIYYAFSIITLNWGIGSMFSFLLHLEPGTTDFQKLMYVLQVFFSIIYVSIFGLFIIHGSKNSDNKFIYSGVTLFILSSIVGAFGSLSFIYFF